MPVRQAAGAGQHDTTPKTESIALVFGDQPCLTHLVLVVADPAATCQFPVSCGSCCQNQHDTTGGNTETGSRGKPWAWITLH
ncbi:hypothetical protein EYF80_025725 [Liparis tanakae]|uniref:Uncharacterized protein n=1 Tax=Liparis tanakae TaxID=230148 RepID=A0A4Z2HGN5_9TELE|nr:hypothetical protein EYF80_025725 [Liparis tanakae]